MQIYVISKKLAPDKCYIGVTVVSFFLIPSQPYKYTHNPYAYHHCHRNLIIILEPTCISKSLDFTYAYPSTCKDKTSHHLSC